MPIGSLRRLLIWVAILGCWEAAYKLIGWDGRVFPSPVQVLATLIGLMRPSAWGSPLARALTLSGARLVAGYAASMLLGIALGLAMWRWEELDRLLGPLCVGLQALPSVCWVPLALLLPFLGATEPGVIFVTVMGSTWAAALSLRDGLRALPPLYRRAGLMLGAHGWKLYWYVLLPSSLPALAGSLRLGFSFAWRSLLGAEVLFAAVSHGLGHLLQNGARNKDAGQVVAIMIVMVAVGMLADRWLFAPIQVRVQARFGLE